MSVTLLLTGTLREQVGRVEEIARPLSLVVKPIDVEHVNEFGPDGARTVQIILDEAESRLLGESNAAMTRWSWMHAGCATAPFLSLAAAIRHGTPGYIEQRAIEALAAVDCGPDEVHAPPAWLARVREHIDDEHQAIAVTELARTAGVHAVYLARMFRRYVGCSITDYRKRRRVQRVARDVSARSRESLSTIAHAAGYADHAHMCREFRNVAGITPSGFRSIVGS